MSDKYNIRLNLLMNTATKGNCK